MDLEPIIMSVSYPRGFEWHLLMHPHQVTCSVKVSTSLMCAPRQHNIVSSLVRIQKVSSYYVKWHWGTCIRYSKRKALLRLHIVTIAYSYLYHSKVHGVGRNLCDV